MRSGSRSRRRSAARALSQMARKPASPAARPSVHCATILRRKTRSKPTSWYQRKSDSRSAAVGVTRSSATTAMASQRTSRGRAPKMAGRPPRMRGGGPPKPPPPEVGRKMGGLGSFSRSSGMSAPRVWVRGEDGTEDRRCARGNRPRPAPRTSRRAAEPRPLGGGGGAARASPTPEHTPEGVQHTLEAAARADVARAQPGVAAQHVPQRRGAREAKLERDALERAVRVLHQSRGEQQPAPADDRLRGGESGARETVAERLAVHAQRARDVGDRRRLARARQAELDDRPRRRRHVVANRRPRPPAERAIPGILEGRLE